MQSRIDPRRKALIKRETEEIINARVIEPARR